MKYAIAIFASALMISGSAIASSENDEHKDLMKHCGEIINTHKADWGFTGTELDGKHDLELYCHLHKHEDAIKADAAHHGAECFKELVTWAEHHSDLPKKDGAIDCSGVAQHK